MVSSETDQRQSVVNFVLAARAAEIRSLEALSKTCQVIKVIADLVHDLQRERGLTNVNLASGQGGLMSQQRSDQVAKSLLTEEQLRSIFSQFYLSPDQGPLSSRLLNSIAYVLQGLSELAFLRQQIEQKAVDARVMTKAFSCLIAALLDVVNEAADSSGDPMVSRALVSMINFMQGKEYAGQERAWGAIGFAQGHFDKALRQRLDHLQAAQSQALSVYEQFGEPESVDRWRQLDQRPFAAELARLHGIIAYLQDGDSIAPELSEVWYSVATAKIDCLHDVEVQIINDVVRLSQARLGVAKTQYQDQLASVAQLSSAQSQLADLMLLHPAEGFGEGARFEGWNAGEYGTHADQSPSVRSIYDLIREQNEHLAEVKAQLDEARQALAERKLVEQAKGLLMKSLKLTEEQAYRRIQQRAMESNMRLAEVSQMLIDTARSLGR